MTPTMVSRILQRADGNDPHNWNVVVSSSQVTGVKTDTYPAESPIGPKIMHI